METPEQVVAREIAFWRMAQKNPIMMNGETPEETDRWLEFKDELAQENRAMQYALKQAQRQYREEIRESVRRMEDAAVIWHSKTPDYLAWSFPRLTWRDIWLALW
jgi:hypothetical protein